MEYYEEYTSFYLFIWEIIVGIWTILLIINWRRKNAEIATRWGVFDLMKEKQYYQKPSFKRRERAKRRKINIKKAEKLRANFL